MYVCCHVSRAPPTPIFIATLLFLYKSLYFFTSVSLTHTPLVPYPPFFFTSKFFTTIPFLFFYLCFNFSPHYFCITLHTTQYIFFITNYTTQISIFFDVPESDLKLPIPPSLQFIQIELFSVISEKSKAGSMDLSTAMVILALVAAYFVWLGSVARSLKGPKGPRLWPVLGSLPGLIQNNSRMHEWIADNLRACGGTYQTCIFAIPFLARKQGLVTVTCDPKNLEHILKGRFDNYPKGPTWQAVFHDLLGDGIFNSDGDTWLFQRKTAALEFTTRTLRQAMARWVSRAIKNRFCPILETAQLQGKPVDLQDLLLRITFDNICGLAFGKDPQTLSPGLPENSFASAFDRATEASLHRFILPEFIWKSKKWLRLGMELSLSQSLKHVDEYLTNVINTRKLELTSQQQDSGSQHDDLLSRFMKKRESYTDKFLQHVALNFILAGRDTSSVALSWFFWLLTVNPTAEEKILLELCSVLTESRGGDTSKWLDEPLVFEEVDRLVYLKAALSETLRLYPSVPEDSKHVIADDMLPDGTFVPAGSNITYSIYSSARMKSIWGDDCLEFKPERWLSEDGKKFEAKDQFRFVAFNAGPRICLGKDLAYLQMKSIAAAVLLRHRLEVAAGHKVEQKMSLTLFMKDGLKVNVFPRDLTLILDKIGKNID